MLISANEKPEILFPSISHAIIINLAVPLALRKSCYEMNAELTKKKALDWLKEPGSNVTLPTWHPTKALDISRSSRCVHGPGWEILIYEEKTYGQGS
jgi:hypothetical protein